MLSPVSSPIIPKSSLDELNKIIDDFCALQSEQEETIEMLKDDLGSGSQQLI